MSIESGLQFLHANAEHRFTDVPDLSVVQMLCNLLDAFLHYIHKQGGLIPMEDESEQNQDQTGLDSTSGDTPEKKLLDFSTLMYNYSSMGAKSGGGTKKKKQKQRMHVQQKEENIEPFLFKLFVFSFLSLIHI